VAPRRPAAAEESAGPGLRPSRCPPSGRSSR